MLPLILLAALTFFIGLGHAAIADSDEAFYAEAAREMVESGDWLTPHFNYQPRFQKPILYYWLTAATFAVTGPSEAGARLWSACAGLGLVLVTAACARRWYDDDTALVAGAIAATNFGYFALSGMALPDLPLAFFITLGIFAAFMATLENHRTPRRWLVLSAVSLALGFLTKGPLALVLPAIVVVPLLLIERRRLQLSAADLIVALLVFVAIAVPWYAAMWAHHGSAYLEGFFIGDNLERFATDRFNEPRPLWFYVPVIAGGLLPWTPLTLLWIGPIVQVLQRRRDVSTIELRLLLWAGLPLLFFTASIGKQPRYILPILPPLAILLAVSLVERTRAWRGLDGLRARPRPGGALLTGAVLSGLVLVTLGALIYRARPILLNVPDVAVLGAVAVLVLSGALVIGVSFSSAWRALPLTLAAAAAVSLPALRFGVFPPAGADGVRQMSRLIDEAKGSGAALTTYNVFVRNLVFYTRSEQVEVYSDAQLRDFLIRPDRVLAVLPAAVAERIAQEPGVRVSRVADLVYFNAGALRVGTALAPDPGRDLERIVLVTNR